jgi:hypothetical protein
MPTYGFLTKIREKNRYESYSFSILVLKNLFFQHPIIILKGIRWSELRHIVEYMYKGEISVSHEDIDSILQAAESLQVCRCFSLDVQLPIRAEISHKDMDRILQAAESRQVYWLSHWMFSYQSEQRHHTRT